MSDSKKKYDTSEPILVLIRRGRRGRGFSVAPIEDVNNPAMCQSLEEVAEVIKEMIDDESQPRVNLDDLRQASAPPSEVDGEGAEEDFDEEEEEEYEDEYEEDEDPAKGTLLEGVAQAADPTDQLIFNMFSRVVKKGQDLSSKPRKRKRSRARARKSQRKKG